MWYHPSAFALDWRDVVAGWIVCFDRLRFRGPNGARDEFHLAAAAQTLRKLAKLIPMPALTAAT
jgi:hypothetical protein